MKKLLVTGASGLIGSHLLRQAAGRFEVLGTFQHFRPQAFPTSLVPLDVTDAAAVIKLLTSFQPDFVIHCAALADSDQCEHQPDLAQRINVDATRTLSQQTRQLGAKLILLSTDLVFDGLKSSPYIEDDPPTPLGVYARTKADAEQAVRENGGAWLIARTSLVYGQSPRGDRSINERLGLALAAGQSPKLFVDEFRCPINVSDLAAAILELADSPHTGVFHVAGPERWSRYDLGIAFARHFGWPAQTIEAKRRAEVPLNRPRPADLVLDSGKARAVLKTKLRGLDEGLRSLPITSAC